MRAARVKEPNIVVSLPEEPGPEEAIEKPCVLKKICRAFTSAPVTPSSRSRVKLAEEAEALALVPPVPMRASRTLAIVALSAPKVASRSRMDVT